ncbi:hypothetical protein GCM10010433_11930 [Streptomyces pulveraceus]
MALPGAFRGAREGRRIDARPGRVSKVDLERGLISVCGAVRSDRGQWAVLEPLLPKGEKSGRPPRRTPGRSHAYDTWAVRHEATVLVVAINEWL